MDSNHTHNFNKWVFRVELSDFHQVWYIGLILITIKSVTQCSMIYRFIL